DVRDLVVVVEPHRRDELRLVVSLSAATFDVSVDAAVQRDALEGRTRLEAQLLQQLSALHDRYAVDVDRADPGTRLRLDREQQRRAVGLPRRRGDGARHSGGESA